MAWTLQIHHLDVLSVGDATIFVARENGNIRRTVLIDGGETKGGAIIHNYLTSVVLATSLDVLVATHFDKDHFYGLIPLLEKNHPLYANTIVYDGGTQKDPATERPCSERIKSGPSIGKCTDNYIRYREAVIRTGTATWVNTRTHATRHMNGYDIVSFDVNGVPSAPALANVNPPNWLLGKEIMWGDGNDGLSGRHAFNSIPPAGAPTITCIAANKYVRQRDNTSWYITTNTIFEKKPGGRVGRMSAAAIKNQECGEGDSNKNARSLAFLVQFNNFRYYIGGDLESAQEDGYNNINALNVAQLPNYRGAKFVLNRGDNLEGRILAMKTSHHGSETASSRDFINYLRPNVAFISTGSNNTHRHPAQATVNVLDGYLTLPINRDMQQRNRHPAAPPPPPMRPVFHYVTGYKIPASLLRFGGDASMTAGDPRTNVPGHIILSVFEDQSRRPASGQTYRGILAAATTMNARLALTAQLPLATLDQVAELGTTFGVAEAIAKILGVTFPEVIVGPAKDAAACAGALGTDANTCVILIDVMINAVGNPAYAMAIDKPGYVANAIHNAGLTTQLNALPTGALQTAIAVVSGQLLDSIRQAALNIGASLNAANAAAYAVEGFRATLGVGRSSAFAAIAAMGAATMPTATVQQAAMVGAGIGASMPSRDHLGNVHNPSSGQTAYIVTAAGRYAGAVPALASLAGAVAGSAFYFGDATAVKESVEWALQTEGIAPTVAAVSGNAAMAVAQQNQGGLFNVSFTNVIGPNNEPAYHSPVG